MANIALIEPTHRSRCMRASAYCAPLTPSPACSQPRNHVPYRCLLRGQQPAAVCAALRRHAAMRKNDAWPLEEADADGLADGLVARLEALLVEG